MSGFKCRLLGPAFRSCLGHVGPMWGLCWAWVGLSLALEGPCWTMLGLRWVICGFNGVKNQSQRNVRSVGIGFGPMLGHLKSMFGTCCAIWCPSWDNVGPSGVDVGAMLGPCWVSVEARIGCFGTMLGQLGQSGGIPHTLRYKRNFILGWLDIKTLRGPGRKKHGDVEDGVTIADPQYITTATISWVFAFWFPKALTQIMPQIQFFLWDHTWVPKNMLVGVWTQGKKNTLLFGRPTTIPQ